MVVSTAGADRGQSTPTISKERDRCSSLMRSAKYRRPCSTDLPHNELNPYRVFRTRARKIIQVPDEPPIPLPVFYRILRFYEEYAVRAL